MPDGSQALSGSSDNTLRLWDIQQGKEIYKFSMHVAPVRGIALTEDGRRAISVAEDHTLKVIDLVSREVLASWESNAALNCCFITAGQAVILAGDQTGRVHYLQWTAT